MDVAEPFELPGARMKGSPTPPDLIFQRVEENVIRLAGDLALSKHDLADLPEKDFLGSIPVGGRMTP
jgi:hypothetical protein